MNGLPFNTGRKKNGWQLYNEHIAYIFEHMDETKLQHTVTPGETDFTLQFIIDDYADHLEHHLKQVLEQ